MLYLADLLKQDPKLRFGYADDLCLYRSSPTLEENATLLAEDVRRVLQWGEDNKVSFAPEKCEMIHITRKKDRGNPPIVIDGHFSIRPVQETQGSEREPALRWLGVWFDRKLTFKRHVAERAAKAMALAQHLRSLANTKYGPPADSLRKAVRTCVIPTALYGTEAWYCGRRKPDPKAPRLLGREVNAKVGWHVDVIQRILTLAVKATLPVWRTTPVPTIFRDAGLPTAQMALDEALWRFSYRLQTVDEGHLLAKRTEASKITRGRGAGGTRTPRTKVQIAARLLPSIRRPILIPLTYPPGSRWDRTGGLTKRKAAEAFEDWYRELPSSDVVVFTDGSQEGNKIGYGFAVYQDRKLLSTGCGKLDPTSINFDAEVVGAWKWLQYVITALPSLSRRRIWVCLDNTGVIWGLRTNAATSS
ncbi:hypothetical protein DL766_008345 [Monosporascus sp. MC13-8B]|uniref:Reverse transcriptase domain-containing protein n=1 Tax=Monosporascus cannonballus TaxID=155416 RepID=A0ABY0H0V6_9PEZI|nr:hypothetical protein DL762_006850 [Monosporascus cannonballus]RYO84969.1 hypothetical protein DL763_007281 [Monosporascus cannonballus]RYP19817.1 hypothetical protein DL766_008345 [Monosporascus sp. MC13-8B]